MCSHSSVHSKVPIHDLLQCDKWHSFQRFLISLRHLLDLVPGLILQSLLRNLHVFVVNCQLALVDNVVSVKIPDIKDLRRCFPQFLLIRIVSIHLIVLNWFNITIIFSHIIRVIWIIEQSLTFRTIYVMVSGDFTRILIVCNKLLLCCHHW